MLMLEVQATKMIDFLLMAEYSWSTSGLHHPFADSIRLPWDKQTCGINVGVFSETTRDVQLVWTSKNKDGALANLLNQSLSEWDIKDPTAKVLPETETTKIVSAMWSGTCAYDTPACTLEAGRNIVYFFSCHFHVPGCCPQGCRG